MTNDSLGDRMKLFEGAYRFCFSPRMPIIIRCDGKAFHSYTRGCKSPVDENLVEVMNLTAIELCNQVQGCQLAYIQSDEISLLLNNFKTYDTQSWFDNNIQKVVSVAASIAGATFTALSGKIWGGTIKPATFDARAFVLPKEEVCNGFIWRQQDATRNSVQMLARSLYSHRECNNKVNSELQEMIFQKGQNWNDCPTSQKRGRCVVKQTITLKSLNPITKTEVVAERSAWVVDNEIPIFSQDREYIEHHLAVVPVEEVAE
jgi:tRNA(His) guanylyltransferase